MKNLGQVFESLAYEYSLPKAIKEGFLSPIKAQTIPLQLDLTGVGMQSGDFRAGDLDTALDPYLYKIAEEMTRYCHDRKNRCFSPAGENKPEVSGYPERAGIPAAEVNGNSDDRETVLRDFDQGKYNVLCNSMLLTEGWDCPVGGLYRCAAPHEGAEPVQPDGRTRNPSFPGKGSHASA